MQASTRTIAVTLPLSDASFLRKQARGMGWQIANVPRTKKQTVSQDETNYLLSSQKMTDVITRGLEEANRGDCQIVDIDAL